MDHGNPNLQNLKRGVERFSLMTELGSGRPVGLMLLGVPRKVGSLVTEFVKESRFGVQRSESEKERK